MRVSVVICTYNRRGSLLELLDALARQTHRDFEVVVVDGPSTDGTAQALEARSGEVRLARNPERHLSKSRNIGIAAAAGDIVAFIDDDAIPEAHWLEELVAPFGDPQVAGAGGLVLDHTGVRAQWRYLVCARNGEGDFDQVPPLDRFTGPGADPFLYLPGGNSAFRRRALEQIGGFDEEIEYNYDETEVCLQLHDLGWRLEALDGAVVHHRSLPSHLRSETAFTDPFFEVKNRTYFALRHGTRTRLLADVLASLHRYIGELRVVARQSERAGRMDAGQLRHYLGRADAGFHAGLRRGLDGERRSMAIPPADPAAFVAFPAFGRDSREVLIGAERRPEAVRRAQAGAEVHLLIPAGPEAPYRVDFDAGVWVRTVPVRPRWAPELDGDPRRDELERAAALRGALGHVTAGRPAEVVAGAELLLLDGLQEGPLTDPSRFPTDWELEARACLDAEGDDAFVECVYRRLLGRSADEIGRRLALAELHAGRERIDVIARIARSIEGSRGRGIDPGFLERLPASRRRAAGPIRAAWLCDDDAAFAAAVHRSLLGSDAGARADAARLASGVPRATIVRELAARPEAIERVADAGELPPADVRTAAELRAALAEIAELPDGEFVDRAYRVVLSRPADPHGAAAYRMWLSGGASRSAVLRALATSEEGAGRGMGDGALDGIIRSISRYRREERGRRLRAAVRRRLSRLGGA